MCSLHHLLHDFPGQATVVPLAGQGDPRGSVEEHPAPVRTISAPVPDVHMAGRPDLFSRPAALATSLYAAPSKCTENKERATSSSYLLR